MVEYLGEGQIVPFYQYVCYAGNLNLDAAQLHEIYKQRSDREIWIEQRPSIVDKRKRVGDLEVDLIIGKHHNQDQFKKLWSKIKIRTLNF